MYNCTPWERCRMMSPNIQGGGGQKGSYQLTKNKYKI